MKKFILLIVLFLSFFSLALGAKGAGLVPCGNPGQDSCTIADFFVLIGNVYTFIVYFIATPMAVLMLTIGGVLILISAGNPNLAGLGKKMVFVSIMGLALVFCAWLIVNFILTAMGYKNIGNWNQL